MPQHGVAFGSFVFDNASATLWKGGSPVPLGGRGASLLLALLEAGNAVVAKSALIDRAWPGAIVEDGNLAVQIAGLRKALGPRPDGRDWIATVPRVGYRFVGDLTQPTGLGNDPRPSIAVLPFINMSSDPEQDYFVDGMVEDLITALSRFKTFSVVARHSSFTFKNRAFDVRDAARALGVRYLLEGSVRRTKQQVRVNAQLIDGTSGAHLWAEKLDGTLGDVFDFQDRVTEAVIGVIEPQIRKAEIERSRRKRPESLDAYDLYLQALPLIQGVGLEGYGKAILLLERAIALDPTFAPALAHAAWAHAKRKWRGAPVPPGVDDARMCIAYAERALAADGNDAIVLAIVGSEFMSVKNDPEAGFALIQRAVELNPNSQLVVNLAGFAHHRRGAYDEAIALHLRALRLCPGAAEGFWCLNGIAQANLSAGRFELALHWSTRTIEMFSGLDFAHLIQAAAYAHLDRLTEAQASVRAALSIKPTLTLSAVGIGEPPAPRDLFLARGLAKAGLAAA